jgi:hypothetical protein
VDGAMFFSAKAIMGNYQGIADSLSKSLYRYPALIPVNRNIAGEPSAQPQNIRVVRDSGEAYLLWDEVDEEGGCKVAYYVVYAFKGKKVGDMNNPENIVKLTTENCLDLRELEIRFKGYHTFVVTAVNKFKHESRPTHGVTRKL